MRAACRYDRFDVVKLLKRKKIEFPDDIIIDAFAGRNIDIIEYCVDHIKNFDIHVNNDKVMIVASKNGHTEIMRYLIERGDFVNSYVRAKEAASNYRRFAILKLFSDLGV